MRRHELTGQKFNRLTVIKLSKVDKESYWLCKCDCGNEIIVKGCALNTGRTKSCGCLRSETAWSRAFKGGKTEDMQDYWRNNNLERNYGITIADYDQMLEDQGGVCAICGTDDPKGRGRFHVDHCHNSGEVRGLLCNACNVGLGYFKDSTETLMSAVNYLNIAGKLKG